MNKVFLAGNLVNSVTINEYGTDGKIATGRIAVSRRGEKKETDFFDIKAFGNTATYLATYSQTGDKIVLCGRIQNRTYEKNGEKKYFTEIIIDECEVTPKAKRDDEPTVDKKNEVLPDDLPF